MSRPRRPAELELGGDYETLLAAQDGVCALCRRPPRTRRLDRDHDHRTGNYRGLLCARCNRALGLVERYGFRAEWLERAARYVDR